MPYTIRKKKCKQSDGDSGSYELSYTTKKGEKRRACHTSKKKAQGQIAAIEMESDVPEEEVMSEKILREYIQHIIEGGASAERQELGFVRKVNYYSKKSPRKGITVISNDRRIDNVTGASKYMGRAASGSEPYTDIVIHTKGDDFNVSAKGPTAPSIAGGGLSGMEAIVPGLIEKFLEAAEKWYIENGYEAGDTIPDIYGQLNDRDKMKIVIGTEEIGGPIDLMYIGPMDVTGAYDPVHKELTVSGALIDSEDFANDHDIYLRLRKRRNDQPFAPGEKDRMGLPLILGRSPSRGDTGRRIVVSKSVPSNAAIVQF